MKPVFVHMSTRTILSHLLTLTVIGGFMVLGIGSSGSDDGESSDETTSNSPGAAARGSLEGHLTNGQAYGEGPGGPEIAHAMEDLLDTSMGDAVAVHVTPGTPEQIVVILRLRDLRDMDDSTRQEWLDSFGEIVREGFGAVDSNIVVGIRGNVFFGAVATMSPTATTWTVETGTIVSTDALDEAMAVAASPSAAGQVPQDVYAAIETTDAAFQPPLEDEYDETGPAPADRYTFELAQGALITARMHAPEIDSFLYVLGPDGALVAQNDDYGDYVNSRVDFTAQTAGTYTIVATLYSPEQTGAYALRVRANPNAAPAPQ